MIEEDHNCDDIRYPSYDYLKMGHQLHATHSSSARTSGWPIPIFFLDSLSYVLPYGSNRIQLASRLSAYAVPCIHVSVWARDRSRARVRACVGPRKLKSGGCRCSSHSSHGHPLAWVLLFEDVFSNFLRVLKLRKESIRASLVSCRTTSKAA